MLRQGHAHMKHSIKVSHWQNCREGGIWEAAFGIGLEGCMKFDTENKEDHFMPGSHSGVWGDEHWVCFRWEIEWIERAEKLGCMPPGELGKPCRGVQTWFSKQRSSSEVRERQDQHYRLGSAMSQDSLLWERTELEMWRFSWERRGKVMDWNRGRNQKGCSLLDLDVDMYSLHVK